MNLKRICSILLGLCLLPSGAFAEKQPNILLVYLDDIGPAWLPPYAKQLSADDVEDFVVDYYSEKRARGKPIDVDKHLNAARNCMPFLDTLANEGMVFNRAFASATLCAPSRAGLMGGMWQQRLGIYGNTDINEHGYPVDQPMLVECLNEAGYATAMFGKWHLSKHDPALKEVADSTFRERTKAGEHVKRKAVYQEFGYSSSAVSGQHPLDRGFDYYFGFNSHDDAYFGSQTLWENWERVPKRPDDEYLTDLLTEKIIDFMDHRVSEEQPFFVYYAPLSMHGPLGESPKHYYEDFDTGVAFSNWYAGHLKGIDASIERLFSHLENIGKRGNTLFIFSADNGQTYYSVPPYNAPYKGGKGTAWLGGSAVPLIINMPGCIRSGVSNTLISTLDILPTALDMAKAPIKHEIDGVSFFDYLTNDKTDGPRKFFFSSGLHSTGWSHGYIVEVNKKDRNRCPFYGWAINDKGELLTHLTEYLPDLYPELPLGKRSQVLFHDIETDSSQNTELPLEDSSALQEGLHLWLESLVEPLTNHQENYNKLLKSTEKKNLEIGIN